MENINLLNKFRLDYGYTYKKIARLTNKILRNRLETIVITVSPRSIEQYCKGQNLPVRDEVTEAMANLIGETTADLLESLRASQKAFKGRV